MPSRRSTSGCETCGPGCSPAPAPGGRRAPLADDPARRRPDQGPLQLAILELDGEPAGYATYRIAPGLTAAGITDGKVLVDEVVAPTPEAERELWRFVLDIDWVASIEYDYLPPEAR